LIARTTRDTYLTHGLKGLLLLYGYYLERFWAARSGTGAGCPACGWTGKAFYPYLLQPLWVRPRAVCPQCGALERHRGLYLFYSRLLSNTSDDGGKCLFFAPESCLLDIFEGRPIELVSYRYRGPGRGDMMRIAFPDNTFDWVLSHHVLEHVRDDRRGLDEIHRVLKPGGRSYLSIPLDWDSKTREYGHADPEDNFHYRAYGADVTTRFQKFNWRRIDLGRLFDEGEIAYYGLDREEPLFELTKPEPTDRRGRP
jgi:SAM-dependent methyltransferase